MCYNAHTEQGDCMMKVNRERARVWEEVVHVDLNFLTLAEAVTKLQGYRAQYGHTAEIRKRSYDYGDGEYWAVMQERDETDREMTKRIALEERWAADEAERDRRDFERLKAKFGG